MDPLDHLKWVFSQLSQQEQEPWILASRLLDRVARPYLSLNAKPSKVPDSVPLKASPRVLRNAEAVRQILAPLQAQVAPDLSAVRLTQRTPNLWWSLEKLGKPENDAAERNYKSVRALCDRAKAIADTGDMAASVVAMDAAAKEAKAGGYKSLYFSMILGKAEMLMFRGQPETALELMDQAIAGFEAEYARSSGQSGHQADNIMRARVSRCVGLNSMGRFAEAAKSYRAAIQYCKTQFPHHPNTMVWQLRSSLGLAGVVGQGSDEARRICEEVVQLATNTGHHQQLAEASQTLADIYLARCDYDKALEHALHCITAFRHVKQEDPLTSAYSVSAQCFLRTKRFLEARETIRQYFEVSMKSPVYMDGEIKHLAAVAAECGDITSMRDCWRGLQGCAAKFKDIPTLSLAFANLIALAMQTNDKAEVARLREEAHRLGIGSLFS